MCKFGERHELAFVTPADRDVGLIVLLHRLREHIDRHSAIHSAYPYGLGSSPWARQESFGAGTLFFSYPVISTLSLP